MGSVDEGLEGRQAAPAIWLGARGIPEPLSRRRLQESEDKTFIGDKRAIICADCAYALPDEVPVDRAQNALAVLFLDSQDKWEQAKVRPELAGWFVGQVMKKLNGQADPDEVFAKVMAAFGAR